MNNKVFDPRRISREEGFDIICEGVDQVKSWKVYSFNYLDPDLYLFI